MSLTAPLNEKTILSSPALISSPASSIPNLSDLMPNWKEINRKWKNREVLTPAEDKFVADHYNSPEYKETRDKKENRKYEICKCVCLIVMGLFLALLGFLLVKEGVIKF